mmetsp:Transcript_35295/g.105471  ORF Transcript_35295/g.105471 Transcript_35295/m.105471 type:complete len:221 (-) Transcript_35295:1059-1721(-)
MPRASREAAAASLRRAIRRAAASAGAHRLRLRKRSPPPQQSPPLQGSPLKASSPHAARSPGPRARASLAASATAASRRLGWSAGKSTRACCPRWRRRGQGARAARAEPAPTLPGRGAGGPARLVPRWSHWAYLREYYRAGRPAALTAGAGRAAQTSRRRKRAARRAASSGPQSWPSLRRRSSPPPAPRQTESRAAAPHPQRGGQAALLLGGAQPLPWASA